MESCQEEGTAGAKTRKWEIACVQEQPGEVGSTAGQVPGSLKVMRFIRQDLKPSPGFDLGLL